MKNTIKKREINKKSTARGMQTDSLICRQPYFINHAKKKKHKIQSVKRKASEKCTDWPPYLRLQVSDLMTEKRGAVAMSLL